MPLNFKNIIIDGYNLINAVEPLKAALARSLEAARNDLIVRLQGLGGKTGQTEITVVFDGRNAYPSGGSKQGGIRIVYSRPPANADHLIKTLVEKQKNPRLTLVVSSDLEIFRYARTCGAKAMRSADFFSQIANEKSPGGKPAGSEKPRMTKSDLAEWERLFDVDNFRRPDRNPSRKKK